MQAPVETPGSPVPDLSVGVDPQRLRDALVWTRERYRACDVCAVRCGVDRLSGALGPCGVGVGGRVYKEYLHLGEERCLLPSHTVYLTGCNFRCVFCSDDRQVREPLAHGAPLPPAALARRIARRRAEGARNVNFVGGLPDVNLLYVLETLALCRPDTHVVWNTNLWTTPEVVGRLTGVVGTWLVDHKFGSDRCALKLSGARDYLATLEPLLALVARSGQLVVRHLLMPGHLSCCTEPVLTWLAAHHPNVPVNLMTGYHPFHLAGRAGPLGRVPTSDERRAAVALLAALPFARPLLDGEEYRP